MKNQNFTPQLHYLKTPNVKLKKNSHTRLKIEKSEE